MRLQLLIDLFVTDDMITNMLNYMFFLHVTQQGMSDVMSDVIHFALVANLHVVQ